MKTVSKFRGRFKTGRSLHVIEKEKWIKDSELRPEPQADLGGLACLAILKTAMLTMNIEIPLGTVTFKSATLIPEPLRRDVIA